MPMEAVDLRERKIPRALLRKHHPNAVVLEGKDGVRRIYVPVAELGDGVGRYGKVDPEAFLSNKRGFIRAADFIELTGLAKWSVYRDINSGRFPEGSIVRHRRSIKISAAGALEYYRARKWDHRE